MQNKYLESLPLELGNVAASPSIQKAVVSAPKVKMNMLPQEWEKFHSHWKIYKSSTEIHQTRLGRLLYFACEPQLQRKVASIRNDFMDSSEQDMLTAIKSCCLAAPKQDEKAPKQGDNYSIKRRDFVYIQQKPSETATMFVARLRMAADECRWKTCCPCPSCRGDCGHDASEEQVREQLLRGMVDKDLQQDLMERDESFRNIKSILSAMMARENARARAKSGDRESGRESSADRTSNVDYSDLVGKLLLTPKKALI